MKAAMAFRLTPSDLTLNDLVGSKIKVIRFDVKYVKNGKSYDVGPYRGYIECPCASLWMTLRGHKNPLIRNVLETVRDARLDHREEFFKSSHGLSIVTVRCDRG